MYLCEKEKLSSILSNLQTYLFRIASPKMDWPKTILRSYKNISDRQFGAFVQPKIKQVSGSYLHLNT